MPDPEKNKNEVYLKIRLDTGPWKIYIGKRDYAMTSKEEYLM